MDMKSFQSYQRSKKFWTCVCEFTCEDDKTVETKTFQFPYGEDVTGLFENWVKQLSRKKETGMVLRSVEVVPEKVNTFVMVTMLRSLNLPTRVLLKFNCTNEPYHLGGKDIVDCFLIAYSSNQIYDVGMTSTNSFIPYLCRMVQQFQINFHRKIEIIEGVSH